MDQTWSIIPLESNRDRRRLQTQVIMENDEDGVPVLVDANLESADAEGADAVTAEVAEMNLAKVPLTLVTGENIYRAVVKSGVDILI